MAKQDFRNDKGFCTIGDKAPTSTCKYHQRRERIRFCKFYVDNKCTRPEEEEAK